MNRTGVLLMAHGTPSSMDEMPEYLRLVRGGRPASPELVAEMRHNYEAIGGRSPLTDLTMRQADALRQRLGSEVPVAVGMRNWKPFIAQALDELHADSVTRVVAIPLAPQFSTLSIGKYFAAASAATAEGMQLIRVASFYRHPLLLRAFADRLQAAGPDPADEVIFTAHSLPKRVVDGGDTYVDEVAATARGVAALAGVGTFQVAYQSAGRTPEPWIGPDIGDFIRERTAAGARSFVVAPIGFVCDHTEILFDIDVQAKRAADAVGASLRRTESLNTSPGFIAMLEDLVRTHL
jgi:protoporphyrin/coproporphyrin ferrochelatase